MRPPAPIRGIRQVEECPHLRLVEAPSHSAVCMLLREIAGVREEELCAVRRDACEACCRDFPPSTDDINPVIASLLHHVADEVVRRGGVPGCTGERALALRQRACDNIPLTLPSEEASGSWAAPSCKEMRADSRPLEQIVPLPRERWGQVRRWAVGVTTAARRLPTLAECLSSLRQAGWSEPYLFVDGDVVIPEEHAQLSRTVRRPAVGAWPNYYLALEELFMREPEADAYLLVQDDVLFFAHPDLRVYLEQAFWPGSAPGVVSLFCSAAYTQPESGWHRFDGRWVWGAQCFAFERSTAMRFLQDAAVQAHRTNSEKNGLANIDVVIGEWTNQHGIPIYFPTPSLVQHIGHVSTLWQTARIVAGRRADRFAGSRPKQDF